MTRELIDELRMERLNEVVAQGGTKFEDSHTCNDWLEQLQNVVVHLALKGRSSKCSAEWRRLLVRLACKVIAAIETHDRKASITQTLNS